MVFPASTPVTQDRDSSIRVAAEPQVNGAVPRTLNGHVESGGGSEPAWDFVGETERAVKEAMDNDEEIAKELRRKEAGKGICMDNEPHQWRSNDEYVGEIAEVDENDEVYRRQKGSTLGGEHIEASTSRAPQPQTMVSEEESWVNDIESEWESLLQQARRSQHTVIDDEDSSTFIEFWKGKWSSWLTDAAGNMEGLTWRFPLLGNKDFVERKPVKHSAAPLALGQVLSFLVTITGVSSAVLSRKGIFIPTTQSFLNYVLLSAVYIPSLFKSRSGPQVSWYIYFILAVLDVEANYLVVKAYQYTPITSVMLLDAWTIPCVILLTWFLLKCRYSSGHFWGVGVCMVGLCLVVFSDVHSGDEGGKAPLLGDLLVLAGATLYGFCNVLEEFLAKRVDKAELVGKMGLYGMFISFFQLIILERNELATVRWNFQALLAFFSFGIALFLFYILVPFMLQMSGSALFNLSLLTSDMWGVAVRSLAFHQQVDALYFVALATVASGLCVYSCSGEPMVVHDSIHGALEPSVQPRTYEVLDIEEENHPIL